MGAESKFKRKRVAKMYLEIIPDMLTIRPNFYWVRMSKVRFPKQNGRRKLCQSSLENQQ